jgi:hypothetical protein
MTTVNPDILIANHGSVVILKPVSNQGALWLESNIGQDSGYQPMWPSVLVESRYVQAVLEGAISDGLVVR